MVKREMFRYLADNVRRATLVPLQLVSALVRQSEDWVTAGDVDDGWQHAGTTAYYSVKTWFTKSLHANNGWATETKVDKSKYRRAERVVEGLRVEVEGERFPLLPFPFVEVRSKKKRRSSHVEGVPF